LAGVFGSGSAAVVAHGFVLAAVPVVSGDGSAFGWPARVAGGVEPLAFTLCHPTADPLVLVAGQRQGVLETFGAHRTALADAECPVALAVVEEDGGVVAEAGGFSAPVSGFG
jgi:hypothetical protein